MKTTIVPIGNSRGVRIPKSLLIKSQLPRDVELKAKRGEIRIVPARKPGVSADRKNILSLARAYGPGYSALAKEWDTPEEDEAWAHLQ